jgi:hypothetical protein
VCNTIFIETIISIFGANRNGTVENVVLLATKPNLVDYFQLKHTKRLALQDKHANFEETLTRRGDYIAHSTVLTTVSPKDDIHKHAMEKVKRSMTN